MNLRALLPVSFALLGIILFAAVLGIGGNVVLYQASEDAFSAVHKDSGIVPVMTTEEAETIMPLMADIIAQSYNVVIEIDAKDFEYSGRELSSYENLISRLKSNNAKIKLTNTDINDFRAASDDLNIALSVLNSDVARLEQLKQEIIDNAGNTSALYSLYSEVQVLSKEISLTAETYAETAEIMIEVAKGYDLDTAQLTWAIDIVNKVAAASEKDSASLTPGSSAGPDLQILFTLSADSVAYGDTLKIEGSSRSAGELGIYLDNDVWGTVNLSTAGSFTKSFRIEEITPGLHIVSIRTSNYVSKLAYFTVVSTPTVISIHKTSQSDGEEAKKLTVIGKLETTDNLSVSDAPVNLYAEETGLLSSGKTNENGVWSISAELADGEYHVYAEFASKSFPLGESVSEPVLVKIASPTLYIILIIIAAGVLVFVVVRILRRKKTRVVIPETVLMEMTGEKKTGSPARTIVRAIKRMLEGEQTVSDSDGLRVIYRTTVAVIAAYEHIESAAAKTPREILQEVKRDSDEIKSFILEYEYLHYADVSASDADMERMKAKAEKIAEGYHDEANT